MNEAALEAMLRYPTESLSVELKTWLDIDSADGQVNLIRTLLALRNQNGGYMILGFNDKTGKPDPYTLSVQPTGHYTADKVQALISRFSSEPFGVSVGFGERDGQVHPIIEVPVGVRSPVVATRDLIGSKKEIRENDVYVRTLNASNVVSTSKATHRDWKDLSERCFENREADIGAFLRRHLSGVRPEMFKELLNGMGEASKPLPTDEELIKAFADESLARYSTVTAERKIEFMPHGFWEAVLWINGDGSEEKFQGFPARLGGLNPNYSGWPVWLDPTNMSKEHPPYVFEDLWEAVIPETFLFNALDFLRLDPKGRFYLRRPFEDDTLKGYNPPRALETFEIMHPIYDVAEALAVGLAFGKGMSFNEQSSKLSFFFRWTGLKGRQLASWGRHGRRFRGSGRAVQDQVSSFIQIPLETPVSSLGVPTYKVVNELFRVFDGYTHPEQFVSNVVAKYLNREERPR